MKTQTSLLINSLAAWFDCVGFNNTSTLVGHFVLSPIEREKINRSDSIGDETRRTGEQEENE